MPRPSRIVEGLAATVAAAMAFGVAANALADPAADQSPVQEAPAPYVDRLIDGGALAPMTAKDEGQAGSSKGNVRSLIIELGGSRIQPRTRATGVNVSDLDRVQEEAGLSLSGRYQTDNYGMIGIDAELRRGTRNRPFIGAASSSWSGSVALSDKGLPLGDGWLADSALGMVAAPAIPLARQQSRFYIPAGTIRGGSVTFRSFDRLQRNQSTMDPEPVASLNLSAGEPGLMGGLRLADFTGLSGLAVSGGGQLELSPRLTAGAQAIAVNDTRDPYAVIEFAPSTPDGPKATLSSQAAIASLAYRDRDLRVQGNAIWSRLSENHVENGGPGDFGSAAGGWIDVRYRSGSASHSGGLYYLGPGLIWGSSVAVNNAYGGYYRFARSSQRWRWTFNIDAVDSVNGQSASGVIVNADVRRQVNFTTHIGLNSTLRVAQGRRSHQLLSFVDFSNILGSTRFEAGWSHDPATDLYRVGWNQTWSLPAWLPSGSRLSTQVLLDHRRQSEDPFNLPDSRFVGTVNNIGAGITAGASPVSGVSFDATLAYNDNAGTSNGGIYGPLDATGGVLGVLSSQQGRSLSATVAATARLSSRWSLSASYTDTRSSLATRFGLPDLATSPLGLTPGEILSIQRTSFRLRAGYVTLRYSVSAGRQRGTIGAREYPVGGSGVLEGRVFLDANANHKREPSEAGVGGIVVILDGIQATRSDPSGHYHFDGVSDGPHKVTVNADALPLPWSISSAHSSGQNGTFAEVVEVGVRSTTMLDIGAIRE